MKGGMHGLVFFIKYTYDTTIETDYTPIVYKLLLAL